MLAGGWGIFHVKGGQLEIGVRLIFCLYGGNLGEDIVI